MTVTGLQIRALAQKRGLVSLGKTTALAGATGYLTDTIRLKRSSLDPAYFGEAYVRITGVSNADRGHVAKVEYIDPVNGYLYFSPPAGAAIVNGCTYEVMKHGIEPDDYDRGRDRGLGGRCQRWELRELSLLSSVDTWTTVVGAATLAPGALAFPREYLTRYMRITGTGIGDSGVKSETVDVQPNEQYAAFGLVSARTGTAKLWLWDVGNGVAIAPDTTATWTYPGFQLVRRTYTIPANCGQVQLICATVGVTDVADWAGVGLLPAVGQVFSLPASVKNPTEVGQFYAFSTWDQPMNRCTRNPIDGVHRERSGDGAAVWFDGFPGAFPVYYMQAIHYAALQSDYLALADRIAGDDATTDCRLEYVEAAAAVELLENRERSEQLDKVYLAALKDLDAFDATDGAEPTLFYESKRPASIPLMRF